jgi:low temperature requirement protein LtrA
VRQLFFDILIGAYVIWHGRIAYADPRGWLTRWHVELTHPKWRAIARPFGAWAVWIGLFAILSGISSVMLWHGIRPLLLQITLAAVITPFVLPKKREYPPASA